MKSTVAWETEGYVYNGSKVSPVEMFIHVDKVSSYINPREDRVDAQHSVMRE